MEINAPIIFGIDAVGLIAIPIMLAAFGFAVWFGATRAGVGIDEEEAARRQSEMPGR